MMEWLERLFDDSDMLEMGHLQRKEDLNLGMGWIYYALARTLRPKTAVVIGSWRGFVPITIAKALNDNAENGRVLFIDPSLADDFWTDADRVRRHFDYHDASNVDHVLMTTEQFKTTAAYAALDDIGLLFVDGYHDAAHAQFDHEAFRDKLNVKAYTVFHDSVRAFVTYMYGRENSYTHDVFKYIDELRSDPTLDVMDFPFASGMTIVRSRTDPDDQAFAPFIRPPDTAE